MAFPFNPIQGTTHGIDSRVWLFNGYAWDRLELSGARGATGATGADGAGVVGSNDIGVMYLKGNTYETPITVINERAVVNGNIQTGYLFNFVKDTSTNSLRYIGTGGKFHIIATFNFWSEVSNNTCGFYIGRNTNILSGLTATGDRISESEVYIDCPSSSKPVAGAIQTVVDLNTDDRVFFIVQNKSAAKNITVEFLKFIAAPLTSERGATGATGPTGAAGTLNDLSDVTITGACGNDVLYYDSNSNIWINKSVNALIIDGGLY